MRSGIAANLLFIDADDGASAAQHLGLVRHGGDVDRHPVVIELLGHGAADLDGGALVVVGHDDRRGEPDPELGHGAHGLDYDPNFADSSQVTAERGENETLVNNLIDALHAVEHALEKFDTDRYGICESCGRAIAPARLEARPEASLCIDCAAASARR